MTQNRIIELAREAGFKDPTPADGYMGNAYDYRDGKDSGGSLTRFAALVRAQTLEEAAGVTGEFAQKWWSMHCASNKHMDTTRKAHDDFCALQAAIRALKGQS